MEAHLGVIEWGIGCWLKPFFNSRLKGLSLVGYLVVGKSDSLVGYKFNQAICENVAGRNLLQPYWLQEVLVGRTSGQNVLPFSKIFRLASLSGFQNSQKHRNPHRIFLPLHQDKVREERVNVATASSGNQRHQSFP